MISLNNRFIYDIMISLFMKTQPTLETKLADWNAAFNSISNRQSDEAQILDGLITGLQKKMILEGMVVIPGVA